MQILQVAKATSPTFLLHYIPLTYSDTSHGSSTCTPPQIRTVCSLYLFLSHTKVLRTSAEHDTFGSHSLSLQQQHSNPNLTSNLLFTGVGACCARAHFRLTKPFLSLYFPTGLSNTLSPQLSRKSQIYLCSTR